MYSQKEEAVSTVFEAIRPYVYQCDEDDVRERIAEAIAVWNRRADPLVEELRGALENQARYCANLKARTDITRLAFREALAEMETEAREALALPVGGGASREPAQAPEVSSGPAVNADEMEAFQARVKPWMHACFGDVIPYDRQERGDRFLEEVFELLQSGGYDRSRVAQLRDYTWNRPPGEPRQEVGGVMVTLAAYCLAHDLDMHEAGEAELARIWTKVEAIRAKQAAKPRGIALPVDPAALAQPDPLPETSGDLQRGCCATTMDAPHAPGCAEGTDGRNVTAAARRVIHMTDDTIVTFAKRDPSMFRDVAAALLTETSGRVDGGDRG